MSYFRFTMLAHTLITPVGPACYSFASLNSVVDDVMDFVLYMCVARMYMNEVLGIIYHAIVVHYT